MTSALFRVGGMGGILGLDLPAAIKVAETLQYDPRIVAELIAAAESPILEHLNKKPTPPDP